MLKNLSAAAALSLALAGSGNMSTSSSAQQLGLQPHFDYSTRLGCGDVFFHAINALRTEILQIEVDASRVDDGKPQQRFELPNLPPGVTVTVALYRTRQINRPNCRDVFITETGKTPEAPEVWRAVRGSLEVHRGPRGVRPDERWLFSATIRLTDAAFRGPNGRIVEMTRPYIWQGFVGWQAG